MLFFAKFYSLLVVCSWFLLSEGKLFARRCIKKTNKTTKTNKKMDGIDVHVQIDSLLKLLSTQCFFSYSFIWIFGLHFAE